MSAASRLNMAERVRALGAVVNPAILSATESLYSSIHRPPDEYGVSCRRDVPYGEHARQRLDVYSAGGTAKKPRPILIFVHGGGFVGGDRATLSAVNVAVWAARQGALGIAIGYRLAPDAPWPSGADDIEAALAWILANASSLGGDPERLFLMGHSAGAAHAAAYAARVATDDSAPKLAGLVLLSGIYDLTRANRTPGFVAYYGSDAGVYLERSSAAGLAKVRHPVLLGFAEAEPYAFQRDTLDLARALGERDGSSPRLIYAAGNNHFSEVLSLNTEDNSVSQPLGDFIGLSGIP